ncbi:unnamed protein product [Dibothriocephalus latus]|uniref:Uncharacterized protein n=1 Tax=Dibothriocephalus latus TaxID=60516 RepID=A0A3P7MBA8_DIBLA|nr:unnamed protein product [Dibothriocephalus latus]
MEGVDEGIFGWVTLNFLKGSLFTAFSQGTPTKSGALSGLLDFGGGSTQLTFLPLKPASEDSTPEGFLHSMSDCYVEHFHFPSKVRKLVLSGIVIPSSPLPSPLPALCQHCPRGGVCSPQLFVCF